MPILNISFLFIVLFSLGLGSLVGRLFMFRPEFYNPFLNVFSQWLGYVCLIIAVVVFAVDNGVF